MDSEEKKKLLEELEARKKEILEASKKTTSTYEANINGGAILGINDAITLIKKIAK
jgi:hypothetical protein